MEPAVERASWAPRRARPNTRRAPTSLWRDRRLHKRTVTRTLASWRSAAQATGSSFRIYGAAGYNVTAIPLAAGVLASWGIVLAPAAGAVLMSLSTVIVAANAQRLRKTNPASRVHAETGFMRTREDTKMEKEKGMKYGRFLAMIGTSTAVMFVLMYFNSFTIDDVFFSETRFWMAFVMGAAMTTIMLSFMLGMYQDVKKNILIVAGSAIVFAGALWLVRSQQTIDDVDYMRAMIPHHSIAILTSERAHIRDPRTRELAKAIITAQRREIAEMKYLIASIEENGVRPSASEVSR